MKERKDASCTSSFNVLCSHFAITQVASGFYASHFFGERERGIRVDKVSYDREDVEEEELEGRRKWVDLRKRGKSREYENRGEF